MAKRLSVIAHVSGIPVTDSDSFLLSLNSLLRNYVNVCDAEQRKREGGRSQDHSGNVGCDFSTAYSAPTEGTLAHIVPVI